MKLDVKAFALASAAFLSIWYLICILLFVLAPGFAFGFFNLFTHGIDLALIAKKNVTLLSGILGLVLTFAISWLSGALFAILHNKFAK